MLADPSTPVATLVDDVIALDDVDEESVVQTRFATTALALLRAHLGDDLRPAVTAAREALRGDDGDVLGPLLTAEQVTFLGRGWTVGLAHEAALKLRESAQAWTEAYPAMEYRHGPISIAGPGRVTWALGEVPDGLPDEVRATGAHFEHRAVDPLAEMVRIVAVPRPGAGGRSRRRCPSTPQSVHHPHVSHVLLALDLGGTSIKAELVDRSPAIGDGSPG